MQFTYRMILSRLLLVSARCAGLVIRIIRICAGPRVVQLSTSPYFSTRHAVLVEPYVVARDAESGDRTSARTAEMCACALSRQLDKPCA